MRRLLMFLVLATTVVLAGCEFIPDDIEERVSQEFCAENPDHEICDLDNVEEIEQEIISTFVQNAFSKINGDGCLDVVFTGNEELLNTCENTPTDLVPEGVTSFSPLYFEQDGSMYMLYGTTNVEGLNLEVSVRVVDNGGAIYLDHWSVAKDMYSSGEISEMEAEKYLQSFFMDYDNYAITNDDFCMMYYGGIDNDCDGVREGFFDNNTEIISFELEKVSAYEFRGHVTVLKASGGNETVDVEVEVFRQEFGPVQTKRLSVGPVDILGMGEEKLAAFIPMLFDPAVSDDQLLDKFSIIKLPDRSLFPKDEFESLTIIDTDTDNENEFSTRVKVKFKAGAELSKKVNIAFDPNGDGDDSDWTIEFIDINPEDLVIDEREMERYFNDYFNSDISTDSFFDIYYGSGENNSQLSTREMYLNSEFSLEITGTGPVYGATILGRTPDNRIFHWTLEVRVNRWESALIDINDPDPCHEAECELVVMNPDENEMIFNWFIDMYFDPTVSDDVLNELFFDSMLTGEFFDVRKEVQSMKPRYQILEQVGPSKGGVFIYLLDTGNEADRNGEPTKVKVMKRIDKSSPLLLYLDPDDDGDSIPTDDEINARLAEFQTMANHQSIAYPVMCSIFTPEDRVDDCSMMISRNISNGYMLTSLIRLKQRPDILMAEWENAVGEKITEQFLFYPYFNSMDVLVFELIPYIPTEYDMLLDAFSPYVESLNNPNHSVDETCVMVDESSQDECVEMKSYLLASGNNVAIESAWKNDGTEIYIMSFVITDREGNVLGYVEYDVAYEADNPLYKERGQRGTNPLFE